MDVLEAGDRGGAAGFGEGGDSSLEDSLVDRAVVISVAADDADDSGGGSSILACCRP